MVQFKILLILLLQNGVQSMCPTVRVRTRSFDGFDWNSTYELYQYKAVNELVQTPLFGLKGDTRNTTFKVRQIQSACRSMNTHNPITYIHVEVVDFNNDRNMFRLKYRQHNQKYFCDAKYRMEELLVVDFDDTNFISFYGCQMVMVDGNLTMVDGAMIFLTSVSALSKEKLSPLLNYTYSILEDQANITVADLKTNIQVDRYENSCGDLTELSYNCFLAAEKKRFTFLPKKQNDKVWTVWSVTSILIAFGIVCVLIAKYVISKKNSNRVDTFDNKY